ncbi:sensor histidine kinase [Caulobacter radicis]|uniref:sensor histidine kinase n=1 Tax=Caulobacter radicis TaxID=2172650 RepID=UPI000D57FBCB|nr:HAMP domain-containing sensor histidine kinase [Caulobacter radicis]PVM84474.1 sensor histidine kinase [Caulobacter radicis]
MSVLRPRSLRGWLISRLAVAQFVILLLFFVGNAAAGAWLWFSGSIVDVAYERSSADAVARSVKRSPSGQLYLSPTRELKRLSSDVPGFWFIVRDRDGSRLSQGSPPSELAASLPLLDIINSARLAPFSTRPAPALAVVQWIDTEAGPIQLVTSGRGRATVLQVASVMGWPALVTASLIGAAIALMLAIITPLTVRRALRGLDRAADEAKQIDVDRSGTRLGEEGVPVEILPFVRTINDTLDRLDKGYESQKRFLADAAHELRTPIAILTTRLSALPPGPERNRLLEDAARLTALADQLLDLQRLEQRPVSYTDIDLVGLAERVVLDLAPMAFAAGYQVDFEPEVSSLVVRGDQLAIERALTNLIQNAISYGGRTGSITIRVLSYGWIEVADQGPGIAGPDHARVFEPFHRLTQDGQGVGLGLDLVRRIMQLHGGEVTLATTNDRGACFRLIFPLP